MNRFGNPLGFVCIRLRPSTEEKSANNKALGWGGYRWPTAKGQRLKLACTLSTNSQQICYLPIRRLCVSCERLLWFGLFFACLFSPPLKMCHSKKWEKGLYNLEGYLSLFVTGHWWDAQPAVGFVSLWKWYMCKVRHDSPLNPHLTQN